MPKNKIVTGGIIAALAIALAVPAIGAARTADDRSATEVAAEVQAFYDQTRTLQTGFTQAHYHRLYRRTTQSRGLLRVIRPGQVRFDYLGGDTKVVALDGERLTIYEPTEDGQGQVLERAVADAAVPSALGLITGTARLDRDFRFRLIDGSRHGWRGPVLELRPREDDAAYRRVFLYVDPNVPGVVRRLLIQDHEGNLNRFVFQRMRFNRAIDPGSLAFDAPSQARRL